MNANPIKKIEEDPEINAKARAVKEYEEAIYSMNKNNKIKASTHKIIEKENDFDINKFKKPNEDKDDLNKQKLIKNIYQKIYLDIQNKEKIKEGKLKVYKVKKIKNVVNEPEINEKTSNSLSSSSFLINFTPIILFTLSSTTLIYFLLKRLKKFKKN